jgi:hypothetical protein
VIDREQTTVGGHPAFRIDVRATTGKVAYRYVVDIGGQALVLDTYEGYCDDYDESKAVLDKMVSSLRFLSEDAG